MKVRIYPLVFILCYSFSIANAIEFDKYILSYAYVKHGNYAFINDNPVDGFNYSYDYWFRVVEEGSLDAGPQIAFGRLIKKSSYMIAKMGISGDYYDYNGSKISLSTISPQFGVRYYFVYSDKLLPYIEFDVMKRFAFVSTKNYASPESFREDYEKALSDISSPLRLAGEIGLDYNIYENLFLGFSVVTFYEWLSGKALARGEYTDDGYAVIIYDFKKSRLGQSYNINISLHF